MYAWEAQISRLAGLFVLVGRDPDGYLAAGNGLVYFAQVERHDVFAFFILNGPNNGFEDFGIAG